MRINGEWFVGDDVVARPVLRGKILCGDASWRSVAFLVDTGADRTVLSADVLQTLGADMALSSSGVIGIGGIVDTVVVRTTIQFLNDARSKVDFRGEFAAVTQLEALDMSVLGRDILDLFALIVDRPGDAVCLLGQRHGYVIQQAS